LFAPLFSRLLAYYTIYLLQFYLFTSRDIILLCAAKNTQYLKRFGCGKYDSRLFNSVRLLREIETRIDFVGFETRPHPLLANCIATCVECTRETWTSCLTISANERFQRKSSALKSEFNLLSELLLTSVPFPSPREQDDLISYDVPSKFVQIYRHFCKTQPD